MTAFDACFRVVLLGCFAVLVLAAWLHLPLLGSRGGFLLGCLCGWAATVFVRLWFRFKG
jgi:hypothetical protein